MKTEFQLQDQPRGHREVLPHDSRDAGISAEGIFTQLPGTQALSETYSISWDSTNQCWVLWAQCAFLEPVKMVATQEGTENQEPDPTELIAKLWETRSQNESANLSAICAKNSQDGAVTVESLVDQFAEPTRHHIFKEKPPLLG